jgi:hypothetical protein
VRLGVNVPNFGPGTNPDGLRRWALTVAGHGTIGQIIADLGQLRSLGADTVVLDPFNGDPGRRPGRRRRGGRWRQ